MGRSEQGRMESKCFFFLKSSPLPYRHWRNPLMLVTYLSGAINALAHSPLISSLPTQIVQLTYYDVMMAHVPLLISVLDRKR